MLAQSGKTLAEEFYRKWAKPFTDGETLLGL